MSTHNKNIPGRYRNAVNNFIRTNRPLLLTLSAAVVFVTTYLLILPALTLDEQEAARQGGIDVPAVTQEHATDDSGASMDVSETTSKKDPKAGGSTDASVSNEETSESDTDAAAEETAHSTAETTNGSELSFEGDGYSITAAFDAKAGLPQDTELAVSEIGEGADEYDSLREEALKAVQDADSSDITDLQFAYLYDISLLADGEPVEPDAAVDVSISYEQAPKVSDAKNLRIVHFAADENGNVTPEVLNPDDVQLDLNKGKLETAAFAAESFSVYGVVYTVDFSFDIDGKDCSCSIEGGDSTSLKEILIDNEVFDENGAEKFVQQIDKVDFTAPEYLWNGKIEKDCFAGDLKKEHDLNIQYAANLKKGNVMAMDAHPYSAPDWVLISLKPFTSEETLTMTMKNGDEFKIKVTDAQEDAVHNPDGTVQTIPNPQGTTFELFNYFVSESTKTTPGRDQWPGHIHDDNDFWKFNWYDLNGNYACDWGEGFNRGYDKNNEYLLGYGNNIGINQGHAFKFTPANSGTVIDGTKGTTSVDGDAGGLNSWTEDADPRQGIVQGVLSNGYPILTDNPNLGTDGTTLAYLFDSSQQNGKESKGNVNNLLYVDPDGYYTYDSRDFKAEYQSDGTFKLSDQPDTDDSELKGFWPFGDEVFWAGLHMNTQFSMPENGQVLNPKDEYKDMQFEFSGDDDTWLYIDSVLVGDGGGIHNRTEIDVNFATGKVTVTGRKDTEHMGTFEETRWLDDIFKAAGRYKDADWEEIPGTDHKRFKAGTYHTFDMFYLERGGGESNLYIHYNLVSTDDFTGHKSYEGFAADERMARDQFHFEMIGLDGQYQSVWDSATQTAEVTKLNDDGRAIMPTKGRTDGAGTFDDPKKVYDTEAYTDSSGNILGGTVFTTGVLENGDIRFGSANISQEEMHNCDEGHPSLYRYIIREIVPDDAVNDDGVTWAEATPEQKAAGGFVKNQVKYDYRTYYMTARVTSWDQTGTDGQTYKAYGLSKTYYTDDTFTEVDDTVSFVDFRNLYAPESGNVDFTKVDGSNTPLPGAEFTLYTDRACTMIAKDLGDVETGIQPVDQVKTSDENGKVSFENMAAPRTYYMKETRAPEGYEANNTIYKVIIEDSKDRTKQSRIVVDGDSTEIPVTRIVNTKTGELSVLKEWRDQNGNAVNGGDRTARVKIQRKHYHEGSSGIPHTVNFTIRIENKSDLVYTYTANNIVGSTVTVDWWDTNQPISLLQVTDSSGNPKGYQQSSYWDNINHKNRIITISDVTSDINAVVTYPSDKDWLFNSEHTPWMKDVAVAGSGPSYDLEEDTVFNGSTDPSHFAELKAPGWSKTWTLGEGKDFPSSDGMHPYLYYIVEVDENGNAVPVNEDAGLGYKLIGYSSNNNEGVDSQGSVTVYNEVEAPTEMDITINKFEAADINNTEAETLKGATFKLEKYTSAEYQEKDVDWEEQTVADDGTGTFSFTGLSTGFYKIIETETPAGYVKSSADPTFEVRTNASNELEVIFTDTDLVTYTQENGFRIGNTPGTELPSAGGPGTTWMYLLGAVLLLGCGTLLVARRRLVR